MVGEHYITFLKEVVLERLSIVDGFDFFVDGLIDVVGFGEGVFFLHVGYNSFLNVEIDKFHLSLAERVFSCEEEDVFEDALGAKYFGVLVGHVVLGEGVEGRGEDIAADIGQPLL